MLAILPGIPVPGWIQGVSAVEVGGGSGGSWLACRPRWILSAAGGACRLAGCGSLPSSWLRPPTLLRPRRQLRWLRPQRRGKRTVQGLSCRRWRCWPSFQESPFLGWIQGVEVVEVSADPAAAGLRVGPGGSCRRRVGARLAACRPPADPVGSMGGEGKAVQGLSWRRWRSAAGSWLPPTLLRPGGSIRIAYPVGWPLLPPTVSAHPAGPASGTIAARPASGGSCAGCDLNGGGKRTVQGLSWGRWRCWPSSLESSFLGRIQGVEVVEVGGAAGWPPANGVGWLRLHPIRLALSPTLLRRGQPPAACGWGWLRPQRRGKGWPYRDYRGGGGGVGRPPWNPLSWADSGRGGGGGRRLGRVGLRRILSAALGVSAGPCSLQRCRPIQLARPPTLLRPRPASGGSCAGCDLNGGGYISAFSGSALAQSYTACIISSFRILSRIAFQAGSIKEA